MTPPHAANLDDGVDDLFGDRDVVVLRWPHDKVEVERLAAIGAPRLLLVAADADPPDGGECEEDWVRLPADDRDVAARLTALGRRAARHHRVPTLDEFGRLQHRGQWVLTSPIEHRIVAALLLRFGAVVPAKELLGLHHPGHTLSAGALRVHVARLRKRIDPLGLDIRSVRAAGYVMEEQGRGAVSPVVRG